MRPAAILVTCVGLAAVVLALLTARDEFRAPPEVEMAETPPPAVISPTPEPARLPPPSRPTVTARPVAPGIVAPPPLLPDELERVEPRRPLSEFAAPTARKRDPVTMLHRPVIEMAGVINSGNVEVTLAGIAPLALDELCTDSAGREWRCGIRARTALRGLVRGRAVACDLPPDLEIVEITATCHIGQIDIAGWLVDQGWARAVNGGAYAEAQDAARKAGRGMYGPAPQIAPLQDVALPPRG